MLRILLILLVALVVYALVDCVRYDRTQMPGGLPKALWVTLIIVFPAAGALAWLVVSRVNTQAQRAARSGRAPLALSGHILLLNWNTQVSACGWVGVVGCGCAWVFVH